VVSLLKQGVCANALNIKRKAACETANELRHSNQIPGPIFKGKPLQDGLSWSLRGSICRTYAVQAICCGYSKCRWWVLTTQRREEYALRRYASR
jgi:hypothetical protein